LDTLPDFKDKKEMTNKLVLASTAIALVASITMASAESIDITDAMRMSCDFNKNGFIDSPTTLFKKRSEVTEAEKIDISKENNCIKDINLDIKIATFEKNKIADEKELAALEKKVVAAKKEAAMVEKEYSESVKRSAEADKASAEADKAIDAARAEIKRKLD
jgi:valyl-tRNA synthetase